MKRLSRELRDLFLDFWRSRDHRIVKSAPLVPRDDPTLLFTSAGMVPFKKYYSSKEPLEFRRAASIQKCLRATDLEDVGHTPRHCTFFEMLGHFSFGDYFKREAIVWNWDFFTRVVSLPTEKLRASVFENDDEAYVIWRDDVGVPSDRIFRLGAKDNFWGPAGETGACGPCSELYYDLGEELGCGRPECNPGCDCDRWIEVGNFVFPQFDRQSDGSDLPLPNRGIDTGIGFERLTMVMKDQKTIFETDLFVPLLERICEMGAESYEGERKSSYHIIADHIRALAFALTEGILPANDGRGYLIRRLLRRAAVQGHRIGLREPFLFRLVDTVVEEMAPVHPELREAAETIRVTLRGEEERFESTLEQGLSRFEELVRDEKATGTLSGRSLFVLYDTFGFPTDLTAALAKEEGLGVDLDGFEREMEAQRERSRASAVFYDTRADGLEWEIFSEGPHSAFVGYDQLETEALLRRVAAIPKSEGEWWVVVESTPCYAESGGQEGDTGSITGPDLQGEILHTSSVDGEIRHRVRLLGGTWKVGTVRLQVDSVKRAATRRNHTATHLLQAALRNRLGKHVTQAGSHVGPNRLRFDFTHTGALTPAELEAVERSVNDQIMADHQVDVRFSSYDEAIADGVMALFGEKYEDRVRRIRVPGFSEELCGGTHVARTGQIGSFIILSEGGIAAGVRRIEALTGTGAAEITLRQRRLVEQLRKQLQGTADEIPGKVQQLLDENQKLRKEVTRLRTVGAPDELAAVWEAVRGLPKGKLLVTEMELPSTTGIREIGDRIRARLGTGAGLVAVRGGGKITLLAVVTDDLLEAGVVKADAIVREAAAIAGGSGGGRGHLAMAGIQDQTKLPEILETMRGRLTVSLGG